MNRINIAHNLGMAGLYVFAISAWTYSPGIDAGLMMMLGATLLTPAIYQQLWQGWLIRFMLAFTLFLIISAISALIEFPPSMHQQGTGLYRWSKLLLFFLPAWWISRDGRTLTRVFLLSVIGLVFMIVTHVDWGNLIHLRLVSRYGFEISSEINEAGLYSSTYLLALILLAPRPFETIKYKPLAWIVFLLTGCSLLLLGYALLSSMSRQSWLALALVGPPVILARYWVWFKLNKASITPLNTILLMIPLLAIITLFVGNREYLAARVAYEKIDLSSLLEKGKSIDTKSSVDIRLNMQTFGIEKWLERPVFGWGIGSTRYVTKQSKDPRMWMGDPSQGDEGWWFHMHNVYVEILLRTGLAGFLGWLIIFLGVMQVLLKSYRSGAMPVDTFLVLLGISMIMLIDGWFGFYVGNNRGEAYWLLLGGAIYSFRLKQNSNPA
jgi:O-antigen ligase